MSDERGGPGQIFVEHRRVDSVGNRFFRSAFPLPRTEVITCALERNRPHPRHCLSVRPNSQPVPACRQGEGLVRYLSNIAEWNQLGIGSDQVPSTCTSPRPRTSYSYVTAQCLSVSPSPNKLSGQPLTSREHADKGESVGQIFVEHRDLVGNQLGTSSLVRYGTVGPSSTKLHNRW